MLTLLEVARAYLGVEFAMVTRQVIDCAQGGSAEKLTRAALLLAAVVAGIMVLYASAQYLRGWLRATLDREWKTRLSHKLLHRDLSHGIRPITAGNWSTVSPATWRPSTAA